MTAKRPNSRRNLDIALERLVGKENLIAKRAVMANAIVAQMLPDGSVKGGSAIKMRLGDGATRFTTDLDIARASALEDFTERLAATLREGWEGFSGTLAEMSPARPKNVPPQYIMPLHHQIAQKLHAVSAPGSMRAHDLIDLQLLDKTCECDYAVVKETCKRLFAYRQMQSWPPVVEPNPIWGEAYADQLPDGDFIPTVQEAVDWMNELIRRIDDAD